MKALGPLLLAAAMPLGAGSAAACAPSLPGEVAPAPPPPAERAAGIHRWASDIVYGKVIRTGQGSVVFHILHVYKGKRRPGTAIRAKTGWGFDPPRCWGMMSPPPALVGDTGVIAFRRDAETNYLPEQWLDAMIAAGLIKPSFADRRRAARR